MVSRSDCRSGWHLIRRVTRATNIVKGFLNSLRELWEFGLGRDRNLSGMRGVYLVAAKLSERGLIVSPTSRSARGVDLLASDSMGISTYAVQVKTDATGNSFFLVGEKDGAVGDSRIFAFVRLWKGEEEYYLAPAASLACLVRKEVSKSGTVFYSVYRKDLRKYLDGWAVFERKAAI